MLTLLIMFLRSIIVPTLYFSTILICILTIFKKAEWGFFFLVFMIPQPNLWHKLHGYPQANNFIDFLFFAVLLGILYQRKGFDKSENSTIILIFVMVSYFALWNSSIQFSLPLPVTSSNPLLPDWKNYAQMILLYFLALNVIKKEDQQKFLVVLMSIVVLLLAIRSYRNFSGGASFQYDKRVGGPFEAVGLGANHFGAFIAHYCSVFLGLFLFENKKKWKGLFLATTLYGLHPLFFSYSRGAYLAALGVVTFFGVLKKRSLLALVIVILLVWQTLLPASVVDRIMMTETPEGEIEHSAGGRILLWDLALDLFKANPVFGIGFAGYSMSAGGAVIATGETLPENQDVHNYYMRTLCEQGIIGISILLFILYRAFRSGWHLFKMGQVPFQKGLGFGFMGCVVAVAITNMFGDRWSYFALGGYFWIFWGLADRAVINSQVKAQ